MTMRAMRWVDHWVGIPVCFVLGLAASVLRALGWRRRREIAGTGTLAVFKFLGLGSVLQATPLLRAIRKRYPAARLVFVTFPGNADLVRRLDLCSEIHTIRTRSPLAFAADVLREVLWLRRHRVEAVIDLEFFSKFSTLLAFFSGARVRVGFHLNDFWRHSLVTHPVYFNYYRHISDVYRHVASRLDVPLTDFRLEPVPTTPEAQARVAEWLNRHNCPPTAPLLGVNVNAGEMCLERRWPRERFVELIEQLLAAHADWRVVLTGSRDEAAYVRPVWESLSPAARERTLLAAGEWSFDEFLASLGRLSLLVTNDTGPMHLAAAAGVPLVSLWGPGRPGFYAPATARHEIVYADYPCSPCLYMFTTFEGMWCRHEGWCMRAIEVGTVREAVERLLLLTSDPASEGSAGRGKGAHADGWTGPGGHGEVR